MNYVKTHQPCPLDDCDGDRSFALYEDGHGYCFSCQRAVGGKTPQELDVIGADGFRGITKKSSDFCGIKTYGTGDVAVWRKYEAPEGFKIRKVEGKHFKVQGKYPALFGTWLWDPSSSNTVVVVEGEEDLASMVDVYKGHTVALTSATIPNKSRKEIFDYLNQYKKIILAFEDDEAGKKAKEVLCAMLPGKVYNCTLNKHKDANEYVQAGDHVALRQAIAGAGLYTPDFIYNSLSDFHDILTDEEQGEFLPTPFESYNNVTGGIPVGHVTLLTAPEGKGKTEILRALESHIAINTEHSLSITHHEESKKVTLDGMCAYGLGKNTRSIDNEVSVEEKLDFLKQVDGRAFLTDFPEVEMSVKGIMDRFHYLVVVCGVKAIFVDPINQFEPAAEDKESLVAFLDKLSKRMAKFAVDYNVAVVWTAHTNDDGLTRDSRMIGKAASVRCDLERDHMSEDEEMRNRTELVVTKNRPTSTTGRAGFLTFDPETFTINEGVF